MTLYEVNGLNKYTSDIMRTYGAGVVTREEKNATYTVHLQVLEGVSSETPTTRLLILLPAYIFMRGGGGG